MLNNSQEVFTQRQIKLLLTCFLIFVIGVIRTTGTALPFHTPLSNQKISVISIIREKLEQKLNTYSLQKETHFLPQAYASASYDNAAAYALIDFDSGEVIAEKNLSQRVPIASLTKIMTAVVTLDLIDPSEVITVSKRASRAIPTKIVLEPGEKLTVGQLLHAALLTSANDAAQALSDGIDAKYGDAVFVKAMNIKARYIGLKNSKFSNPQGFDDPDNFSTAEDLALLSHYALANYPLIGEIVKKESEYLPATQGHKRYVLYNWNGLVGIYPDVSGIKIGNTDNAGMTTAVISERGGKKLLVVLLGAPGVLERDLWASQLLDLGYEQTLGLTPFAVREDMLQEKYATWVPWN